MLQRETMAADAPLSVDAVSFLYAAHLPAMARPAASPAFDSRLSGQE